MLVQTRHEGVDTGFDSRNRDGEGNKKEKARTPHIIHQLYRLLLYFIVLRPEERVFRMTRFVQHFRCRESKKQSVLMLSWDPSPWSSKTGSREIAINVGVTNRVLPIVVTLVRREKARMRLKRGTRRCGSSGGWFQDTQRIVLGLPLIENLKRSFRGARCRLGGRDVHL